MGWHRVILRVHEEWGFWIRLDAQLLLPLSIGLNAAGDSPPIGGRDMPLFVEQDGQWCYNMH